MKKRNLKRNGNVFNFLKISFVCILALSFAPSSFAVDCTSLNPNLPVNCTPKASVGSTTPTPSVGSTTPTGVKIDSGIKNPIPGIGTIPDFIQSILQFVLYLAVPLIVLAIIYSGFLFVMAAGNTEKLGKAKKTLLYTLIGAALLLGSYVIAGAIKGTVEEISKPS